MLHVRHFCVRFLQGKQIHAPLVILAADTRRSGEILDSGQVTKLCVDSCYSSLEAAGNTIKGAYTAVTDIIVYDNIAYPGKSPFLA